MIIKKGPHKFPYRKSNPHGNKSKKEINFFYSSSFLALPLPSSSSHLFNSHSRFVKASPPIVLSIYLIVCKLSSLVCKEKKLLIFVSCKFMFSSLIFYIYIRVLHFFFGVFCLFFVNKGVNFISFRAFYVPIFR